MNYDLDFYKDQYRLTKYAAEIIVEIVLRTIPETRTVVDVGCGVGTWLSVLKAKGIAEVLGIDGDWVNRDALAIPSECFMPHDLEKKVPLDRRFDLVISLEVAEHLPPEHASAFVKQLTALGDFVLFSAAVPGQGGVNHVNEQWPDYWMELFARCGFSVNDIIRKQVWHDKRIAMHYKQNVLLFVKNERVRELRLSNGINVSFPLCIVHPELYLKILKDLGHPGLIRSIRMFSTALFEKIRRITSASPRV